MSLARRCVEINKVRAAAGLALWPSYLTRPEAKKFDAELDLRLRRPDSGPIAELAVGEPDRVAPGLERNAALLGRDWVQPTVVVVSDRGEVRDGFAHDVR